MLHTATTFRTDDGKVTVSALIRGDGVDLVTQRPGHRATTVQLTVEQALLVAEALVKASAESEVLVL